ncbi:MAG TPA: hypothetical protein PLI79_02985 [Mycobacterium sp.]|nr:hypothetical protein [Mycobacterium sp.]
MANPIYRAERARYASLTRSRAPDDPQLAVSRQIMLEQGLIDAIDRALSKAPPVNDDLCERIMALLKSRKGASA